MQVHRLVENLPGFNNSVITIGTFDGVHVGHRKILEALVEESKKVNGESVLVTFHPHPRKIVQPYEPLQLINSLEEKIELLSATGIDHLVIVPFTSEFASLSATEYMEKFLVGKFHPKTVIIGHDHHFGKGRTGNFALLQENASRLGFRLIEISQLVLNEIAVSSTKIRKALLGSQVDVANELLGYDFFFEGEVIEGDKLGRTLGFPTANLLYTDADKIRLGEGVYAVYVEVEGNRMKGMLSIGNRPTLENSDVRVEVNIFDFDEEIYGDVIRVYVKAYLRPQEKYNGLEELKQALFLDKTRSMELL
jgi:riboflavin kinase / FMN adenylyltransferase